MAGRVVVADPVAPELAAGLLGFDVVEALEPDALRAALGDARALVVRSRTRVTAELLAAAPRLEVVARAGAGLDGIDVAAAKVRGIRVVAAGEAASVAVAELTIGLMVALVRDVAGARDAARAGDWSKRMGASLAGKRLGVVGWGRVGRRVAVAARALGMDVAAAESLGPRTGCHPAEPVVSRMPRSELLAWADILTLHLPLTDATRDLIGKPELARLPRGAFLVNTARGALVDEGALLVALDTGHLAGAALDVLRDEPPAPDHPLLAHPRALVTPHLGASTAEAQRAIAVELARALRGALA